MYTLLITYTLYAIYTLALFVTCVRDLKKFSVKSTSSGSSSLISRYQLSWRGNTEKSTASIQASSVAVSFIK